jgi:alkylhydroperoxidase/carboxymuconolactone decarboxylase family protein YurZ
MVIRYCCAAPCRSEIITGFRLKEDQMNIRKRILDYEYEEVLDVKTRELIRVGCAVAVGCPT